MRPEDIKKLLGGYAAGILTPEEQQALFAAALEDQELFDALAREQALRDTLRDPSARAELLAALDRPPSGLAAFWQWLRQPVVAGLVTAGVAAIAIVTVWRGTRPTAPDRLIVAELKREDLRPAAPAPSAVPPASVRSLEKAQGLVSNGPSAALADKAKSTPVASDLKAVAPAPVQPAAPPPPPPAAAIVASAEVRAEKEKDAAAPADLMSRKRETAVAASQPVVVTGAMEALPLDARAIFYLNEPAPTANAFAQSAGAQASGGGGAAAPSARQARPALAGAIGGVPAAQLGVRASILRGDQEVDLTTVLTTGESVRLKLIPNADGYLRITEAGRVVATAAVQRFKPFETPPLTLEGASPKQLTITFSRTPQAEAVSYDSASRGNLVEPRADQGRATYVISGTPQVVVPVALTFR